MSFRTFLYLDAHKVAEYSSLLDQRYGLPNSKKTIKGKMSLGVAEIEAGLESDNSSVPDPSPALLYDRFEKTLSQQCGEDYFDFLCGDFDMKTLPPMSIARCFGQVVIPESFDTFTMISEYLQPLRSAGLISVDGDPATQEFVMSFFEQTNADIPVLIQGNDLVISSKLKTRLFVDASYQTLEGLEEEELFVLLKVHSHVNKDSVVVFDPAKDFLKLNRSLRRSMKETKGLEPIIEKGPIMKAEIIAIYH